MNTFLRLVNIIDAVAHVIALLLTVLVLIVMLAQVFFRYVLNSSLQWSEELAVWGMIWMVFIGSVLLMRRWEHIGISTFVRLLPLFLRGCVIIFAKLAALVFLAVVVYYGFQVFNGSFHANSPSLGLSTRWIKLAIPIGAILMVVLALYSVSEDIRRLLRGETDAFRDYGQSNPD